MTLAGCRSARQTQLTLPALQCLLTIYVCTHTVTCCNPRWQRGSVIGQPTSSASGMLTCMLSETCWAMLCCRYPRFGMRWITKLARSTPPSSMANTPTRRRLPLPHLQPPTSLCGTLARQSTCVTTLSMAAIGKPSCKPLRMQFQKVQHLQHLICLLLFLQSHAEPPSRMEAAWHAAPGIHIHLSGASASTKGGWLSATPGLFDFRALTCVIVPCCCHSCNHAP